MLHATEPEHGVGIVLAIGLDTWEPAETCPPGVKVLWRHPTWFDPDDGGSVMYEDEVEVISAASR